MDVYPYGWLSSARSGISSRLSRSQPSLSLTMIPVPARLKATSAKAAAPQIPISTSCIPLLDLFSLTSNSRSQAEGKMRARPRDTVNMAAGKTAIQRRIGHQFQYTSVPVRTDVEEGPWRTDARFACQTLSSK